MSDASYTLVAVETASIQSYIFASNRLRENVGASYLVAAATGIWAIDIAQQLTGQSSLTNAITDKASVEVEMIYSGGGNIVLLFREDTTATQFVRTLSRKVLLEAPGLQLTFNRATFNWSEALSQAVGSLLQGMKAKRAEQPALIGRAGMGVNIMGSSTSLPAVTMVQDAEGDPWKPVSAETVAKRNAASAANQLLRQTLDFGQQNFTFANELDDLGRSKDESSYIAVVHADGNGLGLLIQGLQQDYPASRNRDYIDYMRWFSEGVKEVATQSQRDMVSQIVGSVEGDTLYGINEQDDHIQLSQRNGDLIFPIRPLVSGGDDVTFICDGRIGLDLAKTFLTAFERYTEAILKQKLSACAGIAIVKTHYPFARAYQLADDLASNAKQARHTHKLESSALDWHITAGGIYGDLDTMRESEYQVEDGYLSLRPIFTDALNEGMAHRSWQTFSDILRHFQQDWSKHRNKAEGLRDVLRKGAVETAIYKVRYLGDSQSPDLPAIADFNTNGWSNGYCGYYDALELMDKYIPLKQEAVTA